MTFNPSPRRAEGKQMDIHRPKAAQSWRGSLISYPPLTVIPAERLSARAGSHVPMACVAWVPDRPCRPPRMTTLG